MRAMPAAFRHEYQAGTVVYGAGCVDRIKAELERRGLDRALVVCGTTVGETPAVIDPVGDGLGDRLAAVFAETTPEKLLDTAYAGAELLCETDADAVVGLGGGSSLDIAKWVSVLARDERPVEALVEEMGETGTVAVPEGVGALPPVFAVPTTLAGADLSIGAGVNLSVEAPAGETDTVRVSDPRLMPAALFYDPELFATTPDRVLRPSAMNGFDKGIEMLYSRNANPITDAAAMRGLGLLRDGLPGLAGNGREAIRKSVAGIVLVQYGLSTPGAKKLSVIHAFGHGVSYHYDVQQGSVHGILAPHVLRYVFEHCDARRRQLAEAFGIDVSGRGDDEIAAAVVDAVVAVRDGLELPTRLGSIPGLERDQLTAVAEVTVDDGIMANRPPGFEPTVEEVESVLRAAW